MVCKGYMWCVLWWQGGAERGTSVIMLSSVCEWEQSPHADEAEPTACE
jgi:hypothetical protein